MSKEYRKAEMLYEGKAKRIYRIEEDPTLYWVDFKDSLTAFNAEKKGSFAGKGQVNRDIASLIFRTLDKQGIEHHWISDQGSHEMVVRKLEIIPLEVVVRNVLAGSTAKKFQIPEGQELEEPLVEFYYKRDELGDPFINDEQALMLKAAKDQSTLDQLKNLARTVNSHLVTLFSELGIQLVDFKLEFGQDQEGRIVLADEITPDSCRLWDKTTGEKLDKDRFRRDLGKIEESYKEVLARLKRFWEKSQ